MTAGRNGPAPAAIDTIGVLRALQARPAPDPSVERCDMCADVVDDRHGHVIDLESRSLMCTCRPCYLLFTDSDAQLRYRAVPDRYVWFPDAAVDSTRWESLQIPVGLAFFFVNSVLGKTVAFYPGPAGATESELSLDAWDSLVAANPGFADAKADVEAVLIRSVDDGSSYRCYLVPIDACYEIVGRLRKAWRGFDGGQDARREIADFFDGIERRARPMPRGARDENGHG